jgi:acetyl-CoA carboxylase biotin carboxyl carrier protein
MSKSRAKKAAPKKTAVKTKATGAFALKTQEIRDLIDFISNSGLNEVNLEISELKLHVKRQPDITAQVYESKAPAAPMPAQAPAPSAISTSAPAPVKTEKPVEPAASAKTVEIRSPMIGTFYRAANPESPSLVNVGDKISKGQTLCIIEAMKLFNEIESEISGTVVKIVAENANPVEYDQVLFVVEPD